MSIELTNYTNIGTTIAGNTVSREETDEKNDRFSQYLMAIKGAKLSETQLQKLGETQANDDRTRTIEKLDHKAKADDEHYRKMRSSGYTVGETRRGVDQVDRALDRKAAETRRDATGEKNGSISEALQNRGQNSIAKTPISTGDATGNAAKDLMPSPGDAVVQNTSGNTSAIDAIAQTSDNQAALQGNNAASVQQNKGVDVNGGNIGQNNASTGNGDAKSAEAASAQSAHMQAVKAGKSTTASLAAALSMMTPVAKSGNAKGDADTTNRLSETISQNQETKESRQNTITQDALTAVSESQQTTNETLLNESRQMSQAQLQQGSGDVATSQSLPNTSLLEQVDRVKLTNRIASAFRSSANQSGTIRMKLHPEALGALTIRMQIEDGKVTAKLETETETAKQVLMENVDSLKRKLKEQNLEVSAFDIEVVPNDSSQNNRTAKTNADNQQITKSDITATGRKNKGEMQPQQIEINRVDVYR